MELDSDEFSSESFGKGIFAPFFLLKFMIKDDDETLADEAFEVVEAAGDVGLSILSSVDLDLPPTLPLESLIKLYSFFSTFLDERRRLEMKCLVSQSLSFFA